MIIPNQRNLKVHFAGTEVQNQFIAIKEMGVRYALYTAFPFVERMVFEKAKSPIMPLKWQQHDPNHEIPKYIIKSGNHTIQDSGLFTLMFGSLKGKKDAALMDRWYNALVEFTLKNGAGATCVEVDCQKVLGVEKAWEYRERFRKDIPNRIINVFHKEDGQKGLDRLIEYLYIGEDPNRPGLIGTPVRVGRMYGEIFKGYNANERPKITVFDNGSDGIVYDNMVVDTGTFYSMCEHHMMPFFGRYVFAYIPNTKGKIIGLSKIARVVDYYAARLQIQERLGSDILNEISLALGEENPPLGMAIYIEGEHLCKTMRGVKKHGKMATSVLQGIFKTENNSREEFLSIAKSIRI